MVWPLQTTIDQTWVSLWSTRWDKTVSVGEWVILIESNQFRFYWGFLHQIKVTCSEAKELWDWEKYDQLIISILSKLGLEYLVFVSTFHATRIVVSNWKIPSLCTFFDSLTKVKYKFIHMDALIYSNGKDYSLMVQWSNNNKHKENKIVKEKKPMS